MGDRYDDDLHRLGAIDETEWEALFNPIEPVGVVNLDAKVGIAANVFNRVVDRIGEASAAGSLCLKYQA